MASMATTRGAACPRRVSVDKTRQGSLKCSCGHNKTDTRHSWPWRVDSIHGARVSGGQRAWVSGDPAGLSQRRSGGHWVSGDPAGIESAAGRRALSQRRAGGVISREWRAWGSGNPGTSRRAWESHRRRRNSHADLQWAMAGITSGDFHATGQTGNRNKIKTFKTKKQNEVKGRRLRLGLVFCHVRSGLLSRCTHEEKRGTRRRGCNSK